ncbi:MAG: hypothetical protein R3B84_07060 [Zavarzinella sp.]
MPLHFQTPQQDGEYLVYPDRNRWTVLATSNDQCCNAISKWPEKQTFEQFRQTARQELLHFLQAAPIHANVPWVVTGHQPELFHPGVWLKNFLASNVVSGAFSLNLIVDHDIARPTITVPFLKEKQFRKHRIRWQMGSPATWEHSANGNTEWLEKVMAVLAQLPDRPILLDLLENHPDLRQIEPSEPVWKLFFRWRKHLETMWGCQNAELATSELSTMTFFGRWVRYLVLRGHDFLKNYNESIQAYRLEYGISNPVHPAALLTSDNDRYELPLWYLEGNARLPVTVERKSDRFTIYAGSQHWDWPLDEDDFVAQWQQLPLQAKQFRPKALLLTLIARLTLGGLFLHGIGGGLYDQVTDRIIQTEFGISPPPFAVGTGTLRLKWNGPIVTPRDLQQVRQQLRRSYWNPQQFVTLSDEINGLISARLKAVGQSPRSMLERRLKNREIRKLNAEIRTHMQQKFGELIEKQTNISKSLYSRQALQWREYPWIVYPQDTLRTFLSGNQKGSLSVAELQ